MTLDLNYPLRTHSGQSVTLVTKEGRDPKYPLMGYIGDEKDLSYWTTEGFSQYGYTSDVLENAPIEGEVFVVYCQSGATITYASAAALANHGAGEIVAVKRLVYSMTPGQRDDLKEEEKALVYIAEIAGYPWTFENETAFNEAMALPILSSVSRVLLPPEPRWKRELGGFATVGEYQAWLVRSNFCYEEN